MERLKVADAMERVGFRLQHRYGSQPIPLDDIVREVVAECGCARGSVLPADHCYDRVNDGVRSDHDDPMFTHAGEGQSGLYWFVGRGHAHTGPRYHYPKGGPPRQVGEWVHGDYRPLTDPAEAADAGP